MNQKELKKPKRPRNIVTEQVVELKTDYSTAVQRLRSSVVLAFSMNSA